MVFLPVIMLFALPATLLIGVALGRWLRLRPNEGEARVADAISLGFRRSHVLLNNVTIPDRGETTQIDHVVVADTGVFVIETKHYRGWIFGNPKESHWTQVLHRRKSKFQNPLRQNYGHVQALQSFLRLPEPSIFSVVVFTGDAEFKTDLGPQVLKLGELVSFLERSRPVVFEEREMAWVIGRIEMKRLRRSIETDEYHLNSVRRRIAKRPA